jgi:hypothetical protein
MIIFLYIHWFVLGTLEHSLVRGVFGFEAVIRLEGSERLLRLCDLLYKVNMTSTTIGGLGYDVSLNLMLFLLNLLLDHVRQIAQLL